jgi:uncharacterized protein YyaL (SSP411 family)
MTKAKDLIEESIMLANYVIENCSSASGLLVEKVDIRTNDPLGRCTINDLGDYVPFIYWLGEKTDRKYCQWAENQIKLSIKYCRMPNNFFDFNLGKDSDTPLKKSNFKIINVSEHGDAILGIVLMYELTKDQKFKRYAMDFFDGLIKYTISDNGLVYSHIHPAFKLRVPLSAGTYSGVFIEELSRFYQLTGDEHCLHAAEKVANGWINTVFFKKHGLFSFEIIQSMPLTKWITNKLFEILTPLNTDTAMVMKSNTNLMHGLLKLYSITKDKELKEAIFRWTNSLTEKLADENGRFYSYWNSKSQRSKLISLETNHAVIDVLLEAYLLFRKESMLTLAKRCADAWLSIQSNSGLIPNSISEPVPIFDMTSKVPRRRYIEPWISRLDSQTDFSIVLLKLYSLTHESKYYEGATKILEGILEKHKFSEGYVEFVDTKTNQKSGFVIETKFLTLLLKLFLLHIEISESEGAEKIVDDNKLNSLIRDR